MRLTIWVPTALILLAIWAAVGTVMRLTDAYVSTPEQILELIKASPWRKTGARPDPATRRQHLEKIASAAALLTPEQRDEMRSEGEAEMALLYMDLTEEEQQWFAQKTVEPFYQIVLKAFNSMSEEERRKILASTRQAMKREGKDTSELEQRDPKLWERLAKEGFSTSYDQADSTTKLMMGPLLEELQRRVQFMRR
jgi:hypothetical protein